MEFIANFQLWLFVVVLLICVKPLGLYMALAVDGKAPILSRICGPLERLIYRAAGTDPDVEMTWMTYAVALLLFNGLGTAVLYALQRLQVWLPLNPQSMPNVSPDSRGMRAGEEPVQPTQRKDAVNLLLGFAGETFGYAIDLGLPIPGLTQFGADPVIKRECIWSGPVVRPSALLVDRRGLTIHTRAANGEWSTVPQPVASFDSMMTEFSDPRNAPEMIVVREQIRSWRFYDHFRSDEQAPARLPQIGTHTPVLGDDGADSGTRARKRLQLHRA